VITDLGLVFDSELSFVSHCREKINKAYSMLGLIKENFIYLTEESFVTLYKSYYLQIRTKSNNTLADMKGKIAATVQ